MNNDQLVAIGIFMFGVVVGGIGPIITYEREIRRLECINETFMSLWLNAKQKRQFRDRQEEEVS